MSYIQIPFAASGTKADIPVPVQPSGAVSFTSGYGVDYTLDPATNPSAIDIEQDFFNGLMFNITSNLQYLQQNFAPAWIAAADNGGTSYSYPSGAIVSYTDGNTYQSIVAGNTATPGTDVTKWVIFLSNYATSAALAAETARAEAAEALKANINNATMTGTFVVPQPAPGDNSGRAATTSWVNGAVSVETIRAMAAEALLAPLNGANVTNMTTSTVPATGASNTQVPPTSWVTAAITAINTSLSNAITAETNARIAADALKANINSPALSGTPSTTTPPANDNTTRIPNTQWVQGELPKKVVLNFGTGWSAGGTFAASHGKGVVPDMFGAYAICLTAQGSYTPGQVVQVGYGGGSRSDGCSPSASSANGQIIVGANGIAVTADGGGYLTPASWQLVWWGLFL